MRLKQHIKDSPSSTTCQGPYGRVVERVEVRATSCPYDRKLILNADEQQAVQRHEDVERKRGYYHLTFLPESLEIIYRERRGQVNTMVMEHF